jgi:hypothetical protein
VCLLFIGLLFIAGVPADETSGFFGANGSRDEFVVIGGASSLGPGAIGD